MLLKIYLWTVLMCAVSFCGAIYGLSKDIKSKYTKDQLLQYKNSKVNSYNPVTTILIIVFPILNILFSMLYTFGYETVRAEAFKKIDSVVDIIVDCRQYEEYINNN